MGLYENKFDFLDEYLLESKGITDKEASELISELKYLKEADPIVSNPVEVEKAVEKAKDEIISLRKQAVNATDKQLKRIFDSIATRYVLIKKYSSSKYNNSINKIKNISAKTPKSVKIGVPVVAGGLTAFAATKIYQNYMQKGARLCAGKHGEDKKNCIDKYKQMAKEAKAKMRK